MKRLIHFLFLNAGIIGSILWGAVVSWDYEWPAPEVYANIPAPKIDFEVIASTNLQDWVSCGFTTNNSLTFTSPFPTAAFFRVGVRYQFP